MKKLVRKTDSELQNAILIELNNEEDVKAPDIGVLVKDGIVTLKGEVVSYFNKWEAIRAAKRVHGVRAIADEITVELPDALRHMDRDIAAAAARQIGWSPTIPSETVTATVSDGWVTLEGEVAWGYQRHAAENLMRHLEGVKGVANLISFTAGKSA